MAWSTCFFIMFIGTRFAAKSKNSIREAKVAERTHRGSPRLFPVWLLGQTWEFHGKINVSSVKLSIVARRCGNTTTFGESKMFAQGTGACPGWFLVTDVTAAIRHDSTGTGCNRCLPGLVMHVRVVGQPSYASRVASCIQAVNPKDQATENGTCISKS